MHSTQHMYYIESNHIYNVLYMLGRKNSMYIVHRQCQIQDNLTAELKQYYKAYLVGGETLHQHIHSHSHTVQVLCTRFIFRNEFFLSLLEFVSHCDCFHSCDYCVTICHRSQRFSKIFAGSSLSIHVHIFHARKSDDLQLFPHVRFLNMKNQFFMVQKS